MYKKDIAEIKKTQRWPLKFSDFFNHLFVIVPVAVFFLGVQLIKVSFQPFDNDLFILGATYAILSLMVIILLPTRLYQQRKFKRYWLPGLQYNAIRKALMDSGFEGVSRYRVGYIWCRTKRWRFSFGEAITIIPDGDTLLINSRPVSNLNGRKPITIFRDSKKIKKLIVELNKAAQSDIFER